MLSRTEKLRKTGLFWKHLSISPASRILKAFIASLTSYMLPFCNATQVGRYNQALCLVIAKYWGFRSNPNSSLLRDSLDLRHIKDTWLISQRRLHWRIVDHENPLIKGLPSPPLPAEPPPRHMSAIYATLQNCRNQYTRKQQISVWSLRLPHLFQQCAHCAPHAIITPSHLRAHHPGLPSLQNRPHSPHALTQIIQAIKHLATPPTSIANTLATTTHEFSVGLSRRAIVTGSSDLP